MKTPEKQDNFQLSDSQQQLVDQILNDFIIKNPDVKIDRVTLIKICSEAMKIAIKKFIPERDGSFEAFASKIIQKALRKAVKTETGKKLSYRENPHVTPFRMYRINPEYYENHFNNFDYCNSPDPSKPVYFPGFEPDTNEYKSKIENEFQLVSNQPLSTFSVSVDTASYGLIRKQLLEGILPFAKLVRAEELINYFKYNYPQPEPGEQIAMTYEIGECPWQSKHKLVKIALKAKEIQRENLPASHLVFLIDCSGSMGVNNRIDMVKNSLKMLANQLKSTDKISIIAFSNNVQILLNNESGSNIENIKNTIDQLYSRGGTNGERAIETAYAIAKDNFIPGGNNRVVLCTDGDFNIGVNTEKELENLISEKSRMNVFLSVYGFGMGNFKDNKVKTLSLKGHGNYAYIDSLLEANQAIIKDYSGAMFAVAKDVKIQVEFNPAKVSAYRLIGYETGKLNSTDFNNDQKEAGVMGVGQQVTALYEIMPDNVYMVDPLKYQQVDVMEPKTYSDEFMTVKVRYKMPEEDLSKKIELAVIDNNSGEVSSDFRFASAVAMFGQILSESNHKGNSSFTKVIELANEALDYDESGNRHEFVKMVEIAMCL